MQKLCYVCHKYIVLMLSSFLQILCMSSLRQVQLRLLLVAMAKQYSNNTLSRYYPCQCCSLILFAYCGNRLKYYVQHNTQFTVILRTPSSPLLITCDILPLLIEKHVRVYHHHHYLFMMSM